MQGHNQNILKSCTKSGEVESDQRKSSQKRKGKDFY